MMIIGYLPSWRHFGRDLGHLNWRPFKWGTFFREDLVMHIVFLQIGACLELGDLGDVNCIPFKVGSLDGTFAMFKRKRV